MTNLTTDFNVLITASLSTLAMNNGWKKGKITQSPTLLFKDGMQISFGDNQVKIWTKPAGERGEFFEISYKEMEEDKRLNAFVYLIIKKS